MDYFHNICYCSNSVLRVNILIVTSWGSFSLQSHTKLYQALEKHHQVPIKLYSVVAVFSYVGTTSLA